MDLVTTPPASHEAQNALRQEILHAAFGPQPPPYDIERRLLSWSRAAASNTLRAIASDLKIVAAFQAPGTSRHSRSHPSIFTP